MKNLFDRLKDGIDSVVEGIASPPSSESLDQSTVDSPMNEPEALVTSADRESELAADGQNLDAGTSAGASTEADTPEFDNADQPAADSDRRDDSAEDFCAAIDLIASRVKQLASRPATEERLDSTTSPQASESEDTTGEAFSQLAAGQDDLKRLFESRIRNDEVQAKAFERLHDELQGYKQNFVRQEVMPLLKDVIYCYDLAAKETERIRGEESDSASDASFKTLEVVEQMLLDILFKFDVEPFRGEADQFDPKTQQCVRTEPTDVEDNDKRIVMAGLSGFRSGETIVRREQVTVYKYKPSDAE